MSRILLVLGACLATSQASAQAQNGCPTGTHNVVVAPDGATLTILFDSFIVEADGVDSPMASATCALSIPLDLPPDTTIGVYKVDYRGFALVSQRQQFELEVVYGFGSRDHRYRRQVRGANEGAFTFSQTIGAGLIRRVGCGEDAVLDVEATIAVDTNGQPGYALGALDSVDAAPQGGLVYYFEYRECR